MKKLVHILGTCALLAVLCTPAWAQWFAFNPPGSVDGKGILVDVTSRCDEQGRRTAYEPSQTTYCHEATHMLNSRIRNGAGGTGKVNALYVGGGRCCILPEPRVTIAQVFANVRQYRQQFYPNIFLTANDWNDQPLYILDEFSAYINGSQAAKELGCDDHGSIDRATWCCAYADALIETVRQRDPQYPHFADLQLLVSYQKNRVQELAK